MQENNSGCFFLNTVYTVAEADLIALALVGL